MGPEVQELFPQLYWMKKRFSGIKEGGGPQWYEAPHLLSLDCNFQVKQRSIGVVSHTSAAMLNVESGHSHNRWAWMKHAGGSGCKAPTRRGWHGSVERF